MLKKIGVSMALCSYLMADVGHDVLISMFKALMTDDATQLEQNKPKRELTEEEKALIELQKRDFYIRQERQKLQHMQEGFDNASTTINLYPILLGESKVGNNRYVIIQNQDTLYRVKEGDEYGGIKVKNISSTGAVFVLNGTPSFVPYTFAEANINRNVQIKESKLVGEGQLPNVPKD